MNQGREKKKDDRFPRQLLINVIHTFSSQETFGKREREEREESESESE